MSGVPSRSRPSQQTSGAGRRHRQGSSVSLAAVLPEILATIPAEDQQMAQRALIVPVMHACDGDLLEAMTSPTAFDFLVVDGVVLKQTKLAGRTALELLGAGDVLAPRLSAARQLEARAVSRYLAHGPVSLAMIEDHFRQAARRWPGIADCLHDCLGRQTHRASMHVAMLHLPRVEDRVVALFADLAERFGRVTEDGILIDLRLTHEMIGGVVAGRRPTVTLALGQLADQGLVQQIERDRWRIDRRLISA